MYIIIVGGGKIGFGAARDLIAAGREVCVVERDPHAARAVAAELGEVALLGDGTEVHVQRAAGMARADVVVAATGRDQANLAVCQVAQLRFDAPRVIARINDPRNERIFREVGIGHTISATRSIVAAIEHEVETGAASLLDLRCSSHALLEIEVGPASPADGARIADLDLPPDSQIALIIPNGLPPRKPAPDDRAEAGDSMVAFALPRQQEALLSLFQPAGDGEAEARS